MPRFLSLRQSAALVFAVLVGLALLWASPEAGRVQSAQAAFPPPRVAAEQPSVPTYEPAARERAMQGARAAAAAEPHGRENPLVGLPRSGTPTLTVREGESVELRSAPGGKLISTLGATTEFDSSTVLSVARREGNWAGVRTQLQPNGELGWVKLDRNRLDIDSVGQSITVDLSSMEARLERDGHVERRWSVGIGAPDTSSPTGHFAITDEMENTFNPAYGCCVIALTATQPNLPGGWTGGNRMAIHGTSLPLGQANSTGCIHASEADLRALMTKVPLGTPVTIRG